MRTNTSTFGGGYYSHGKQFIEDLPIPIADQAERTIIEGLVATLIRTLNAIALARSPRERTLREREGAALKDQIENRISIIFGLSAADLEVVRAVPVPE